MPLGGGADHPHHARSGFSRRGAKRREQFFRQQEMAEMVAGEGRFIALRRNDEAVADAARIIEQGMDAVRAGEHVIAHPRRIGEQSQIARNHGDVCAGTGGGAKLAFGVAAAIRIPPERDHVPAGAGQLESGGFADAGARPGNHRCPTFRRGLHGTSSLISRKILEATASRMPARMMF
jgi:hypothetical protein